MMKNEKGVIVSIIIISLYEYLSICLCLSGRGGTIDIDNIINN